MTYKRYIRKNGKVYGPYIYKSIRDRNGNVKSIYIGTGKETSEKKEGFTLHQFQQKLFPILIAVTVIGGGLALFMQPTGLIVKEGTMTQTMTVNWDVNETQERQLTLSANPESLSISGYITGNGTVRIYAVKKGKNLLIYERDTSIEEGPQFTGMVVFDNQTEGDEPLQNETESNQTIEQEEIADNMTEEVNVTVPETPEEESVTESEPEEEAEENVTGPIMNATAPDEGEAVNESHEEAENVEPEIIPPAGNVTNVTIPEENVTIPEENVTIPEENVTDVTEPVENITNVTQPEVIENVTEGNVTENITEEPEIEPEIEEPVPALVYFEDVCIETCTISGFKENITILVQVEPNTSVFISEIIYTFKVKTPNNPPELVAHIPNISIEKNGNYTLDLLDYFTDPDGDGLTFSSEQSDEINVFITEADATIDTVENFTGEGFVIFTASDGFNETNSNTVPVSVFEPVNVTPEVPAAIMIHSPESKTYDALPIDFLISTKDNTSRCNFSLDGMANVTMSRLNDTYFNYTNSNMSAGLHNVTFFCTDVAGNVSSSDYVYFRLGSPRIVLTLIEPTGDINVTEGEFFPVTINISCLDGECGEINVTLDPF